MNSTPEPLNIRPPVGTDPHMGQLTTEAAKKMPLNLSQFKSLRRRVEKLPRRAGGTKAENIGWRFASGALAFSLAAIPLWLADKVRDNYLWIVVGLSFGALVCGVVAAVCWRWHKDTEVLSQDVVDVLLEDMNEIESHYSWPAEREPS